MGYLSSCCNESDEQSEENEEKEKDFCNWEPKDWEINEWYTELRENDITMHEYNLQRMKDIRKALEERQAAEKLQRQREIEEREKELALKKKELEVKELELEEKAALLEIAIRVNELSIETRFGGLEKRFEELEMVTRRSKAQFNDQMNSSGNDENSTDVKDITISTNCTLQFN